MKKLLIIVLVVIGLLLVTGAGIFYFAPGILVAGIQSSAAKATGLEELTTEIDGYTVHYYRGGQGPPLVLLHGMGDEKNSFVQAAQSLAKGHTIILPDLQGHGKNTRASGRDYSIGGHVAFMEKFFADLRLEKFVLGGNSMGGHISAAYTLARPEQVERLILVNAPGLKLDDHIVYAGFGKKMESREDFDAVMSRVVHTPPELPGPVVDFMIDKANEDFDFINQLAASVRKGPDYDLKERVQEISVPTLILWGEKDQVVKFNVAEGYDSLIPSSDLVILENAGHSPQLEKPKEVGEAIANFLDGGDTD